MPGITRKRLRQSGSAAGAGTGINNNSVASEFFQPPHLKKTSRVRRVGRALSNWLNGLPIREQDDVLAGIDSEHNLGETMASRGETGGVDAEGEANPSSGTAGEARKKKGNPLSRWKSRRQRKRLERKNKKAATAAAAAVVAAEAALQQTPNPADVDDDDDDDDGPVKPTSEDSGVAGEERPPIRIIHIPPLRQNPYHHLHHLRFGKEPPPASQAESPVKEQHGSSGFAPTKKDDTFPYGVSNQIRTAKYSLLTFLPKNLFEQFRRVANIYFLFIIVLQAIPVISNYNVGLAALPLAIILGVTAVKDGIEDWKRHKQDQTVNYAVARCLKHPDLVRVVPEAEDGARRKRKRDRLEEAIKEIGSRVFRVKRHSTVAIDASSANADASDPIDWEARFWKDIRVGDIILLGNNEMIPADVLILATSEPDGACYVETKNLDGETNLKIRKGLPQTAWVQSAEDAARFRAELHIEMPSSNLYSFLGRMLIARDHADGAAGSEGGRACKEMAMREDDDDDDDKSISDQCSFEEIALVEPEVVPLDSNGLLLRGCVLRNTAYIVGVVLYTGPHTKLILNAGGTPSKRSRIERQMNPQIILNFLLLFIICLSCAIVQGILAGGAMSQAPYWVSSFQENGAYSSSFAGFLTFWSSVILFQTLVPISLYLTVELVKTCQAFLIHSDGAMYHRETDTVCVPRAWNLSDDLGQIEYLFSDKTGTLTRNVMEFRRASVGGRAYGHLESQLQDAIHGRVPAERLQALEAQMVQRLGRILPYPYVPPSKCAFVDPQLIEDVEKSAEASAARIVEFFTLLAVCHTVLIEKDDSVVDVEGQAPQPHLLQYKAQSPDEAALLAASRDLGFVFLGREQERVRISVLGRVEEITILHVIEFNSTRKRMSVVVRRADGRLVLYCKGADSTVYERLAPGEAGSPLGAATLEHLEAFAEDGLRTLCLASRALDEEAYCAWSAKYNAAAKAVHGRDVLLDALADELERGLTLLGATAIEDRLQEGVPECIERLQRAGLRIWVLTGDKLETAVNIGFACRLLTKAMTLLIVRSTDVESTREQLRSAYEKIWGRYFAFGEAAVESGGESDEYALIIEGASLKHAFDQRCRRLFLDLSSRCTAVICCRVSPLQKAKVVELLKRGRNAMTLAIGDGANDVSMIQAADIGVGISGQEGMQAVMASDYAISQFRFLARLLLVHGRWSYIRTAEVTLLSFYKNIVFVVLLYWYQFFCGFTAQYVYDYMFLLYFNLLFTVAPIFALGILDRDLDARLLTRLPPIYSLGIRQSSYSMRLFALYVLDAVYQSAVCFFVPYGAYAGIGLVADGYTENKALLGNVMALAVIVSCNLYMVVNTFSWTLYTWLAIPLALLIPVVCLLLYSLAPSMELYSTARVLLEPLFWATFLLTCVIALAPRILLKYVQAQWRPTDLDVAREIAKYGGPPGEDQLVATVERADGVGGAAGFTALPADLLLPPKAAMLHRDDGYPMDAVVPIAAAAAEEEEVTKAALRHSPSSFFTDAVLRRRILPLGSRRSPTLRIFNLRTGRFERINGFAFSQEEGMRGLIEGRAVPAFGTSIGQPEVEQALPRPAMAATASSSSFMHSGSNDIKF